MRPKLALRLSFGTQLDVTCDVIASTTVSGQHTRSSQNWSHVNLESGCRDECQTTLSEPALKL